MICIHCVTPEPLKKLIAHHGAVATCRHCGKDAEAAETALLFDYILARAVENTAKEGDLSQYEDYMVYEGGSGEISVATLDVVLSEWMGLGDEWYFDELCDYAPEHFFVDTNGIERHYFEDDGSLDKNLYDEKWETFVENIRHTHRFFNSSAEKFLDSLFAFLSGDDGALKLECIRVIPKGEELYRARSASNYLDVKKIADDPASQLGPTPKDRASSQRMTPSGISALYCALERETCLSEIRPITGDYAVSVAMTPISHLTLLDLTKLDLVESPKLSILEINFRDALHLKTFANSLVKKMSKPKGRNDDLAYLSTQMAFEYLRVRFSSQVDGLIFPSVQTGEKGTNVVLFPEASVVSKRNYNDLDSYQKAERAQPAFPPDHEEQFENEARLCCVSGSLRYYKVTAIETKTEEYDDRRIMFMSPLERKRLGIEPMAVPCR